MLDARKGGLTAGDLKSRGFEPSDLVFWGFAVISRALF